VDKNPRAIHQGMPEFWVPRRTATRDRDAWEDWVIYTLEAIEKTAASGIATIQAMRSVLLDYLDLLADGGFVQRQKIGRSNYYINRPLYGILTREPMA
jgi:hypothetical protein